MNFRDYLNEGKIKFTMCPKCNEQNDIKVDPKKNKNQYLCDNCKNGYKGSYYEKGKLMSSEGKIKD